MYTIIDPITKGTFEVDARNVRAAARYWLSCQHTFREARDTDTDTVALSVRRDGVDFKFPVVRMP